MDISNKSVAFLLVVAIVISLGGTIFSLNKLNQLGFTGLAFSNSPQGTANLTVNSSLVLTFVVSNVDFGTGYTNDSGAGMEHCVMDTNGSANSADCIGFNSGVSPFVLRNDGNKDLNVSISANKNATTFLGGTNPVFQFFVEDNGTESGSCSSPQQTVWTDMNTTSVDMCGTSGLNYEDSTDELRIHIKVSVPQDATPGAKTTTLIAAGTTP